MESTDSNLYNKKRRNTILLVLFMVAVFTLSFLSQNSTITSSLFASTTIQTTPEKPIDELEKFLEMASKGNNKTVIIAVVNEAYVEGELMPNMLDLFLEGFWQGEHTRVLLDHLMIVAVDQVAYERCRFRGLHCYRLSTEDDQDYMKEEVYMSKGFINMMWRRTYFLIQVLRKGYNFVFTDIDVLWLRSPFPTIFTNHTSGADIIFSVDNYNGNSSSTDNPINTGFYAVKSNNKTISLFEKWYGSRDIDPNLKEQDVLQNMCREGVFGDLGLKVQFLDTRFFSGFCRPTPDIRHVITVHANCCRFIRAKLVDLTKVVREWMRFQAAPPNNTAPIRWSPHVECPKSWSVDATRNINNG